MSRLGDTIRAARLKSGLTPKALGKKCGVAESFILGVEAGTRIVSDDQAQRILKILGVKNPVSAELEVAAEPERPLRPRPKPYVLPARPEETAAHTDEAAQENNNAWLDALGGVVKRVPVVGPDGTVIDHRLLPVIGGKIEGGAPDKVLYYRCPDDSLRGFRIYAGDLLLTVPADRPQEDAVMLLLMDGQRVARKLRKLDGTHVLLQSYDREFTGEPAELSSLTILGRCVRLEKTL